jgi:chitinase
VAKFYSYTWQASLNTFFGPGNEPIVNLTNICNNAQNSTFPGTEMPNCSAIASNIKFCQSRDVTILLSLGGFGGNVGFSSEGQFDLSALSVKIITIPQSKGHRLLH